MSEAAAVEVSEGVWLIKLPLPFPVATLNVYLIRGPDGYLLVDCGLKTQACREALDAGIAAARAYWAQLRCILITHVHPDHFGLAAEIRRRCGAQVLMHPAEAALMTPRYFDHEFFTRQTDWLAVHGVSRDQIEEISHASMGIIEFVEIVDVDRTVDDGGRIGEWELMWAPGHSPGMLTLYSPGRRLYLSSDHIIEKITPNIGLHSWSPVDPLGDYLASLDRIRALDIDLILPSHGRPFRGHREWIEATKRHHRDRCARMRAAVADGRRTAYEVAGVEWGGHLSPLSQRFAIAETLAHLEHLRRRGQVESVQENGVVRWRKA